MSSGRFARALSALALSMPLLATAAQVIEGVVIAVSDGDTLWVAPDGVRRKPLKVRLAGIDAPERCQADGEAARAALAAHVLQRRVEVQVRARDEFGRLVARVVADGEDVNAWIVARGHAWSPGWKHRPGPYAREEKEARAARRGLFAEADAIEPRRFRRTHGTCR
jgi:endonuclease YncB( thermonuclease family)